MIYIVMLFSIVLFCVGAYVSFIENEKDSEANRPVAWVGVAFLTIVAFNFYVHPGAVEDFIQDLHTRKALLFVLIQTLLGYSVCSISKKLRHRFGEKS